MYFGEPSVLPGVSEDLGKEMGSRVCLYVWRELATCIFLASVTVESSSRWALSTVSASPSRDCCPLSGLIALSREENPLFSFL